MSLINKMLQDLESRKNPQAEAPEKKSVYADLKPLNGVPSSRAPSRRLIILIVVVVAIGAGAYGWTQWGETLVASLFPEKPAIPTPVVARKVPPKPVPAPAPAAAPKPEAAPTTDANAPSQPPADKPAPSPVKAQQAQALPPAVAEERGSTPAPVPEAPKKPAMTEKPKPAVTPDSGYWTVKRGETLYSIASKTGIDLWDLSQWNKLSREHVIYPGQRLRLTPTSKSETAPSKSEKASTPVKTKPAVAAGLASPKSASAAVPTEVSSTRETQSGHAVMDRKMKPLSSDDKAESEYRRAVGLMQKGRLADAEKHLKMALSANEAHTPARELLAGIMLQQGHWREAQRLLEQGVKTVPAHYPFAQLLARVYVEHGADQKALAVMEESRTAAANSPDHAAFLAALYQRTGKHAEAVKTYSEAVALNPQEGRWWLGMGISLEAVQDWKAAGTAYQRAIESGVLDDNLLKYARQRLKVVGNK